MDVTGRHWGVASLIILALVASSLPAAAADQGERSRAVGSSGKAIAQESQASLQTLYAANPKARELGAKARAILVFPRIVKAGLMVGGQTGDGALLEKGRVTQFYNISAGSFGFQAGAQRFSYALFFITPSSLEFLKKSDGWSVGSGPSVVVMDRGMAKSITSTTLTQDVYAFPYGQAGLMAGTGIEGSKITQIRPDP